MVDIRGRSREELSGVEAVLLNAEIHFILQMTFLLVTCAIIVFKFFDSYVNISFVIALAFLKVPPFMSFLYNYLCWIDLHNVVL